MLITKSSIVKNVKYFAKINRYCVVGFSSIE